MVSIPVSEMQFCSHCHPNTPWYILETNLSDWSSADPHHWFCPKNSKYKRVILVICWYILVLDIVMRIVALNSFDEVTRLKGVNQEWFEVLQLADATGVHWLVPFLLQLKFSSGERRLLTSSHSSRFYKKTISSHCLDLQKESSLLSI